MSADKNIFVVDAGRLQKFSFSSTYLASYNITSNAVVVHPTSGKVFCINKNECNITVLNDELTLSHSFGSKELKPHSIAIDTKGMVYVTGGDKGMVLKFTPLGEHIDTIVSKGEQPHQFGISIDSNDISIDSNDIMYITDVNKHQVMIFTTEGEFLEILGRSDKRMFNPCGVAVDKTGNMYVCDGCSGEVLVSKPLY